MLIQPDKKKLGDGTLSRKETLKKSFEDTDKRLEEFRLTDHEELKNHEKRLGRPMAHTELIRRVTKLNPNIWAEDSINLPNVVGFYTRDKEGNKKCLYCAFEKGFLPEFSLVFTDAADLPVKEKRGWRTVLTRLLEQGMLTWEQTVSSFGDVDHQSADRWKANTKQFRK